MERLTHERCSGIKSGYWSPAKKEEVVQALGKYEDTGLAPEEIKRHPVVREVHGYRITKLRPKKVEVFEEAQPGYGEKRNNSGEILYRKRTVIDEYNHEDYCSICGKRLCSRFINYCPNCGAKMDGAEEKE